MGWGSKGETLPKHESRHSLLSPLLTPCFCYSFPMAATLHSATFAPQPQPTQPLPRGVSFFAGARSAPPQRLGGRDSALPVRLTPSKLDSQAPLAGRTRHLYNHIIIYSYPFPLIFRFPPLAIFAGKNAKDPPLWLMKRAQVGLNEQNTRKLSFFGADLDFIFTFKLVCKMALKCLDDLMGFPHPSFWVFSRGVDSWLLGGCQVVNSGLLWWSIRGCPT